VQLAEILKGIEHAQEVQDREGDQHPGESFAFTFPVTFAQRVVLRTRRIRGLEFVPMRDPESRFLNFMGCFKPRKADGNAGHQSVHP
jgi:hypothetical protein